MDADIPTDTPAQSIFDNHTSRSITSLSTTNEVSLNTLQYIDQNYTHTSVEGISNVSEEVLRILSIQTKAFIQESIGIIERKPDAYIPGFGVPTQFFSSSSLQELFDTLVVFASKMESDFEISKETYCVRFSVSDNVGAEDTEVRLHHIFANRLLTKNLQEQITSITVNILKVPGEDLH